MLGHKEPIVAVGPQIQFENTECSGVAHFTVRIAMPGNVPQETTLVLSAGTNNKLADAMVLIQDSRRRLRSKALIVMVMSCEHNVGAGFVQVTPERCRLGTVAVQS